jgi:hypothetical protein
MTATAAGPTQELASLLSDLRFEDLPREVMERTEDLFLDWIASAIAGRNAKPVQILERFADTMGRAMVRARSWSRASAPRRSLPPWSTAPPRTSSSRTTCTTGRSSTRPPSSSPRCWPPRKRPEPRVGTS